MKEVVFNEHIVYHISLEFDLLAATWSVESTGQIFTRIVSVAKEHDKEIVIELGLDEVRLVDMYITTSLIDVLSQGGPRPAACANCLS